MLEAEPGEPPAATAPDRRVRLSVGGIGHGVGFIEDEDAIEVAAEPVDNLLHANGLFLPLLRADRSIGGEQDALIEPDRRALADPGQRRDEEGFLVEGRPIPLGILDQLVGPADPDGATTSLHPVVEQDARSLPAFAGTSAVAEKPATAEFNGISRAVGSGGHAVMVFVDQP